MVRRKENTRMTENMKSFLEAVSKDETLIAKVGQMDKDGLT